MGRRFALGVVLLVLAWGSTFAAVKIGLEDAPPMLFAGMRAVLGGATMAFAAGLRSGRPQLTGNVGVFAVLTLLNVVAFIGLQTVAILELPSGLAAVLIYLQPIITGLLAAVLLGEALTRTKLAGLLLGFAGIVVVSLGAVEGHVSALGIACAVGSALAWSLGTITFKRAQGRVDPWWAVALPFVAGGAVLVVAGLVTEGAHVTWSTQFLAALAYSALVGTSLAWVLWFALVSSGEASRASTYIFFVPVVGVVIGSLWLGERIGLSLLAGAALVVAGVFLVNARTRTPITEGARETPHV